ncbi:MAG: VIT domain-containing protein [Acidobacteriota bacterium]
MINNKITKSIILLFFTLIISGMVFGDGFIVISPRRPHRHPGFKPFPLEVKYHHVDVNIDDVIAVTRIDQVFYNPTSRRLEGYYLFPVPEKGVIKKFSMFINGKETPGELMDAKKAKKIYEDIVRRLKDPALLEYSGRRLFKARIFPIEPYSEKRVKISYSETLYKDNSTVEYIYPLNTEKFSAKPLHNVRVKVEVKSAGNIRNVYCPTHNVEIIRKGKNRIIAAYEEKNVKPDMDLKLYYDTGKEDIGVSLRTYKKRGEDGYFFLSMSPGFAKNNRKFLPKDIGFVLDVSGSMSGEKLSKAKKALKFCVENLNPGDRFEIIKFSTEAESLFSKLEKVNIKSKREAKLFIDDLRAIGGTNIDEALDMALNVNISGNRPYTIIFITDGKPTIGETNEERLLNKLKKRNISDTRIFTFGIGNDINTHLLDKLTRLTRAFRSYITPEEDIEVKISGFFTKIESPVLTDLKLGFGRGIKVRKVYPRGLPDIFKGSSIQIFGRYSGSGSSKIVLEGRLANRNKKFIYEGDFTGFSLSDDFIPQLWGARRIGYLLDQIRLNGESKELKNEIIILAKKFGIITPYTSYLIVEDEKIQVRRRGLDRRHQVLAPATAEYDGFGKKSEGEFKSMQKKNGSNSVRASKEVQNLNKASNFAQSRQGEARLIFKDKLGNLKNLARQFRNVQGRAVYNSGRYWVDSQIQVEKPKKNRKIQFAGKEYFDLLQVYPETAQFLALGKNVMFIYKGTLYEIHE